MKQFFTFLLLALSMSAKTQITYCYQDKDKDGYGDPSTAVASGPFGCPSEVSGVAWVNNGLDCDDNDPNVNPGVKWYRDADGDGYHDGTYITSCVDPGPPYHLIGDLKGLDCDDGDATINPGTLWAFDNDDDGYYALPTKTQCYSPGPGWHVIPPPFLIPVDCDDNNAAITVPVYWYLDADHDGYPGSLMPVGPFCTQAEAPADYRRASEMITTTGIDCDDQNSAVTSTRVYKDLDGDGYTDGTFLYWCFGTGINPPFKYTTTPVKDGSGNIIIDCNDNDPIENNPLQGWYRDDDGDKHGTLFPIQIQCNRPAGYFAKSELLSLDDCDDTDPTVWQSGTLYIDNDGDGYDNGQQTMCYGNVPAGYALTTFGSDCNDNDPKVHSSFTFYWDDDHDGYGDPNNSITLCQFTPPKGYVTNGNDCDDGDAAINPNTIWYKDADNDGYSDGTTLQQCTRPANYKLASELTATSGDCDDNNASVNASLVWYKDADNDGYSDGTTLQQCTRPTNYKLASELTATTGDCDDNNASVWQSALLYIDKDGDGYDNGQQTVCYGATIPTGYSSTSRGSDCNDNDVLVHAPLLYYVDADHDGYGSTTTAMLCSSTAPVGYSTNNTDCNDNDANVWQSQLLYIDKDRDGYDNGQQMVCYGATITDGYSLTSKGSDCNDNDATVHSLQTYYLDADHDGYGNPAKSISVCSSTPPSGYVSNNTDCNDNDAKIHAPVLYYVDADHDGYGSTTSVLLCSSKPPYGYSTNNTDCNDNDEDIHTPKMYYVDNDHDGYGSKTTAMLCSSKAPVGYSTNNADCDDNNPAVHPGATEICGNAIDDNCNGQIDEGCTVCQNATGLTTTNITKSAAKLNWTSSTSPLEWEVDYKKSSSSSWLTVLLAGSARSVTISSLASNQNYSWRIKALCGNKWTSYSNTINFKTSSSNYNTISLAQPLPEENSPAELKLYPNPSDGEFTISLNVDQQINDKADIQMIDMVGRIVHSGNANITNGKLQKTMSMSSLLTRGIYIVRIISKDKIYQAKLVCEK